MIAATDEEAARRRWRAALDRYADHADVCARYVANQPCRACDALLRDEQDGYGAYHRAKNGGQR